MMEEGYPNPLEGKFTLDRHMKGIKTMRGATATKEPLPAEAFKCILEQTKGAGLMVHESHSFGYRDGVLFLAASQ